MIGCYDFCGHYEWTFAWLEAEGGSGLVRSYWKDSIARDSQQHAMQLVRDWGIEGMQEYWGHTLDHEAAGYAITTQEELFRIDMHACPSKGFLIQNGLVQYHDYCDHCMGWIGPVMKEAGFVVDHEHNHQGQCWWEMRRESDTTPASSPGEVSGANDVRLLQDWDQIHSLDVYARATDCTDKKRPDSNTNP